MAKSSYIAAETLWYINVRLRVHDRSMHYRMGRPSYGTVVSSNSRRFNLGPIN